MQLKDICTTDVVFCERKMTLVQAAQVMRTRHVGNIVVVDDASDECVPVGMVTDRDIVVKALGNELDTSRVTVDQIMHAPVIVGQANEDVSDAIARMRTHNVRRLPVVGALGKLIGIVALDDLMRLLVNDTSSLLNVIAGEQDRERRTLR